MHHLHCDIAELFLGHVVSAFLIERRL